MSRCFTGNDDSPAGDGGAHVICSRLAQHLSHRVNRSPRVSQDSHPHIQDCMTHTPSLLLPSHLSNTSLSTWTPIRPSLLFPPHGDTPCDDPSSVSCGPLSEPHSPTVSVHAKQSSSQPVLARENFWDSRNFARNLTTTFQFVSRWIQTRQDTFHSAGDQADSNTSKYGAWQYNRCVEWTRRTTLQISSRNIWMDRERSRSQGNFGLESWSEW